LYILGHACIDNSCCGGNSNWGYIQVPGFVVQKHVRHDGAGAAVSEVEIVPDEEMRREIKAIIMSSHPGAQIEIWTNDYRQTG